MAEQTCEVCGKSFNENGVCDDCGLPSKKMFLKALTQANCNNTFLGDDTKELLKKIRAKLNDDYYVDEISIVNTMSDERIIESALELLFRSLK